MEEAQYRTVIIDDSDVSVEQLMFELRSFPQFEVVGIAKNGVNGKKLIKQYRPQLLFLDIELPETTGIQMLDELADWVEWKMEIVFFTCHRKYLIDAVRNPVFDFLQKPVEHEELKNILNRFEQKQKQGKMKQEVSVHHAASAESVSRKNTLMVYTYSGDLLLLNIHQIGFFKYISSERRWVLYLVDGRMIKMKVGIAAKQMLASSPLLFQISQSAIINVTYLELIRGTLCQLYPPFDTVNDLTISAERKKELQDFFACI